MKIRTNVTDESRAAIIERAELVARKFAGDAPFTITYGDGEAEAVDIRQGRPHSAPLPEHIKVMFTVPIEIEVPDWTSGGAT